MPNFTPKNSKKIVVSEKAATTLDSKHRQILEGLSHDETVVLPGLMEEKEQLKERIRGGAVGVDMRLELIDRLKVVREQIKAISKAKTEYYLANSRYVFEYFESKKKIASGENKTTTLNAFFNVQDESEAASAEERNTVQHYLANVDETFVDMENYVAETDVCQACHKGELIPVEHEGIMVCTHCSRSVRYLIENEKPSYKEPPKEVCCYAYKRINHIKKERIELHQVTNKRAKDILKKLGYNKYYEHIPFIKDKLGIKPPVMSPELEERLCSLFMEIQAPYAKYCPEDRVNFLNYYYTVYKLCELLDQRQFLPFFPMLKDREKRIEQDAIWKNICAELNWEFISTV
jgi:hypothetical protein